MKRLSNEALDQEEDDAQLYRETPIEDDEIGEEKEERSVELNATQQRQLFDMNIVRKN